MGEANPEALALIEKLMGDAPRSGQTPDGQQCLHIAGTVLVAAQFALWGDPSVWQYDDDRISVTWGGQIAQFTRGPDGQWSADVCRNPLGGKARWVS